MVMEAIAFIDWNGKKRVGEKVLVPGFERLDLIYIQDGFMGRVFELATGAEVIEAQGFTPQEAIRDVIGALIKKNLTDVKLLEQLYGNDHPHGRKQLRIVNESPAYLAYKAQRQAERLADPFYFSESDRATIQELIDVMRLENLPHIDIMEKKRDTRIDRYAKIERREPDIFTVIEVWHRQRWEYYAMQVRGMGLMMPEQLRPYNHFEPKDTGWQTMIDEINYGRKRDITQYIPQDLLCEFAVIWELAQTKNNYFGYRRFCADGWADLVRLAIDLKKNRDETETIAQLYQQFKLTYQQIMDESQPYQKLSDEIYI